eukprot:SAG11_NODE_13559_length_649_cov_2.212727_1_plen_125_part_01
MSPIVSKVVKLDVCDVGDAEDGVAFDVIVRQAKNDQYVEGRMTPVGRVGLPPAVLAAVEGWLAVVGRRRDVHRCTKGDRPWQRCMVCGPLFPRLGGFPAGVSRTPCAKGIVTAELRAMLALVPSV